MNFDAYMDPTDFEHLPCTLSTADLIALAQSEKYATLLTEALADRLKTLHEEIELLTGELQSVA